MSKLLEKIKKHKNKLLVTAALAAGAGGTHVYNKYQQNKSYRKALSDDTKMHHAGALTGALTGAANTVAGHYGFNKGAAESVGEKFNLRNAEHRKIFKQSLVPDLKHQLKNQLISHGLHTGARKLGDIFVNKAHGKKWNSNSNALEKLKMRSLVDRLHQSISSAKQIRDSYKDAYNMSKQSNT